MKFPKYKKRNNETYWSLRFYLKFFIKNIFTDVIFFSNFRWKYVALFKISMWHFDPWNSVIVTSVPYHTIKNWRAFKLYGTYIHRNKMLRSYYKEKCFFREDSPLLPTLHRYAIRCWNKNSISFERAHYLDR